VRVAQSVEPPVVVREVAGSSPVSHPHESPAQSGSFGNTGSSAPLRDARHRGRPRRCRHDRDASLIVRTEVIGRWLARLGAVAVVVVVASALLAGSYAVPAILICAVATSIAMWRP
jgi:hypothetical protein